MMKLTEYIDKDGRIGYKTDSGNLITPDSVERFKKIAANRDQRKIEAEENLKYLKSLVEKYKK